MSRSLRSFTLALGAGTLLFAGCARTHSPTGAAGGRAISGEEIAGSDAEDLLELIEELRPSWLLGSPIRDPSDPSETDGPLVLLGDAPPQPLFTLQFVTLDGVREIRYLTATSARSRHQVHAPSGLIVVIRTPSRGPW